MERGATQRVNKVFIVSCTHWKPIHCYYSIRRNYIGSMANVQLCTFKDTAPQAALPMNWCCHKQSRKFCIVATAIWRRWQIWQAWPPLGWGMPGQLESCAVAASLASTHVQVSRVFTITLKITVCAEKEISNCSLATQHHFGLFRILRITYNITVIPDSKYTYIYI